MPRYVDPTIDQALYAGRATTDTAEPRHAVPDRQPHAQRRHALHLAGPGRLDDRGSSPRVHGYAAAANGSLQTLVPEDLGRRSLDRLTSRARQARASANTPFKFQALQNAPDRPKEPSMNTPDPPPLVPATARRCSPPACVAVALLAGACGSTKTDTSAAPEAGRAGRRAVGASTPAPRSTAASSSGASRPTPTASAPCRAAGTARPHDGLGHLRSAGHARRRSARPCPTWPSRSPRPTPTTPQWDIKLRERRDVLRRRAARLRRRRAQPHRAEEGAHHRPEPGRHGRRRGHRPAHRPGDDHRPVGHLPGDPGQPGRLHGLDPDDRRSPRRRAPDRHRARSCCRSGSRATTCARSRTRPTGRPVSPTSTSSTSRSTSTPSSR